MRSRSRTRASEAGRRRRRLCLGERAAGLDDVEAAALRSVFGDARPVVTSHQGRARRVRRVGQRRLRGGAAVRREPARCRRSPASPTADRAASRGCELADTAGRLRRGPIALVNSFASGGALLQRACSATGQLMPRVISSTRASPQAAVSFDDLQLQRPRRRRHRRLARHRPRHRRAAGRARRGGGRRLSRTGGRRARSSSTAIRAAGGRAWAGAVRRRRRARGAARSSRDGGARARPGRHPGEQRRHHPRRAHRR